jgi:DNA-directed RNA polymerase subunit H (RpoH/RPB5)
VIDDEPNDTIISKIKYLYEHDGIFVTIFNIKRLQFNILKHVLVPKINILNDEEKDVLFKKYNINNTKQIPEISRFDPQAMAIFLKPGQICSIERESATSLEYTFYRICV